MNALALHRSARNLFAAAVLAGAAFFFTTPTLADEPSGAQFAAVGLVMMVGLVIAAAFYIYSALTLQAIAKKTNTENGWLAWIPIANVILMLNIAKKPLWWIILFFVPLANIIVLIIVWMEIAVACKKPNWWGILMIVPVVNLIILGLLAWGD